MENLLVFYCSYFAQHLLVTAWPGYVTYISLPFIEMQLGRGFYSSTVLGIVVIVIPERSSSLFFLAVTLITFPTVFSSSSCTSSLLTGIGTQPTMTLIFSVSYDRKLYMLVLRIFFLQFNFVFSSFYILQFLANSITCFLFLHVISMLLDFISANLISLDKINFSSFNTSKTSNRFILSSVLQFKLLGLRNCGGPRALATAANVDFSFMLKRSFSHASKARMFIESLLKAQF